MGILVISTPKGVGRKEEEGRAAASYRKGESLETKGRIARKEGGKEEERN